MHDQGEEKWENRGIQKNNSDRRRKRKVSEEVVIVSNIFK